MRSALSCLVALSARLDDLVELKMLDLGRKPAEIGDCSYGPKMIRPRTWYPSIWIEPQDSPIDLPVKGKAIIDYEVTRSTTTITNGKTRHEASLDVQSISPMEEGKLKKKLPGAAKPVKVPFQQSMNGFSRLEPGMIRFDDRPRNTDGQFEPQADGTPDPGAMRAAYGPAPKASGASVGAAPGLGGTDAALLARKVKALSARG